MTGYHYTSIECFDRIKVEGLKPYPIRRDLHPSIKEAIWVYLYPQMHVSHLATVCWHLLHKNTNAVVQLEVEYDSEDRISSTNDTFSLSHRLYDDELVFHEGEQATLLFRPIPPERIRLISTTHVDDVEYFYQQVRKIAA